MAQRSGFFNALKTGGDYDRTYNANDYSENLAVIIGTGVLRSTNDDLKVNVSGMTATVNVGRAWINGNWYHNDSPYAFSIPAAPSGGKRYDRIILRYDNTLKTRAISLVYNTGTADNTPTKPELIRTALIYDIVLAELYLESGSTNVSVTDTRADNDLCGWIYSVVGDGAFLQSLDNSFWDWFNSTKDTLSSVTLFKKYTWNETLPAASNTVTFTIPQYDPETCFIEVYVNGICDTQYTLNNNIITFGGQLISGTDILVNCYKSIDGTGITSVADEITELQNKVDTLDTVSEYTYKCTGVDDNISLSQIAQAIISGNYTDTEITAAAKSFLEGLGGHTFLSSLSDNAQIAIDVVGNCAATTAYLGSGTTVSPYRWFALGDTANTKKRILFNFKTCTGISVNCSANTENYIFYGNDLNLDSVNIKIAGNDDSNITMIKTNTNTGNVNIKNCHFEIATSGNALIAEHGIFINCYCHVSSIQSTAYCFKPKTDCLIRIIGGDFYAYCYTSTGIKSAIIYTSSSDTDAAVLATDINCPVSNIVDYSQGYLSVANAGKTYINGVTSTLISNGLNNEITGQVNVNKGS